MYCLVTRIEAHDFSTLLRVTIAYWRMRRRALAVPGLLETTLLLRPRRTVVLVSLWRDARAIPVFRHRVSRSCEGRAYAEATWRQGVVRVV